MFIFVPMALINLDSVVLRLREGDHVGVLKKTVKADTELANRNGSITTAVTIPAGHKIALEAVVDGEALRKYGQIIGFAEGDIAAGEHVHSQNLVCRDYEREHGRRGFSQVTTEQVPLSQTCGWARVIDVSEFVGTTSHDTWPRSPLVPLEAVRSFERKQGAIQPGDVVLFHSGHVDRTFKPAPDNTGCVADPVNGVTEGWPAPGPEVIKYLASRGIRCVGTDAPTVGGVEPRNAAMTYWALGSEGMVAVEFLIGLGELPSKTYFIFAPIKIRKGATENEAATP